MAAFERAGLNMVSAWPAMSGARVVKTPDELECLKISSAIGDTSFWKIENEWLKPGVKESTITAKVNEYLYERASTSSTTSSSPRAGTPARIAAGTPTR